MAIGALQAVDFFEHLLPHTDTTVSAGFLDLTFQLDLVTWPTSGCFPGGILAQPHHFTGWDYRTGECQPSDMGEGDTFHDLAGQDGWLRWTVRSVVG